MKAAIFSIGTELLLGEIVNTNVVYLSKMLNLFSIDVLYHHTVGDNPKRLKELLEESFAKVDLIITTGGLGPTQDDLTKEVISEYFDLELELNSSAMDIIHDHYKQKPREMAKSNVKQALLPAGSIAMLNNNGTAPGFIIEHSDKILMAFPGPPNEMTPLFETYGIPFFQDKQEGKLRYKTIKTFGIGESLLEEKLISLIDGQTDPTIATYASEGECRVRIASKRPTEKEATDALDAMLNEILKIIGEYVYSTEDKELYEVVAQKLISEEISISAAESCTGGMFASWLTGYPGISNVLKFSLITYSDQAKIDELDVSPDTIKRHSAVSKEVAREMATGLFKKTNSRLCIAVTGYADKVDLCDTDGKNLSGLIYIAMLFDGKLYERELHKFANSRDAARRFAVLNMYDLIYKNI